MTSKPLVLASASEVRARLLQNAGVEFEIMPSQFDEAPLKRDLSKQGKAWPEIAQSLALEKARSVSILHPGVMVIGADQILLCKGQAFDKPRNLAGAKDHLRKLSGATHELLTGTVLIKDGEVLWQLLTRPKLTMRSLSDEFIDAYLGVVGEQALLSVGAYQLEGCGGQLFDKVEGDFFSILGLPLLELLSALRKEGHLRT